MTTVICSIAILSLYHTGQVYRDWVDVKGEILRESGDNYVVDFGREFRRRKVAQELNMEVQKVNSNSCLFQKVNDEAN